jgi:hypothetical protein
MAGGIRSKARSQTMAHALAVERDRDRVARAVGCPVCGAGPGVPCTYGTDYWGHTGHTGRYNEAAGRGLVPPIKGVGAVAGLPLSTVRTSKETDGD